MKLTRTRKSATGPAREDAHLLDPLDSAFQHLAEGHSNEIAAAVARSPYRDWVPPGPGARHTTTTTPEEGNRA